MKYVKFGFLGLLFCCNLLAKAQVNANESNACLQFKTGIFKVKDVNSYTISRTATHQTEINLNTGKVMKLDIKWLSDCEYILYNPTIVKNSTTYNRNYITDTVQNKIQYIIGNKFQVQTSINGVNNSLVNLYQVNPENLCRALPQLNGFARYHGKNKANELIDVNYTAAYYQDTIKANYVLALMENFVLEDSLVSYELIGHELFTLKQNEKIILGKCFYKNKMDTEIVAIVLANKSNTQFIVKKAWRLNRATLKIESIDKKDVQLTK